MYDHYDVTASPQVCKVLKVWYEITLYAKAAAEGVAYRCWDGFQFPGVSRVNHTMHS